MRRNKVLVMLVVVVVIAFKGGCRRLPLQHEGDSKLWKIRVIRLDSQENLGPCRRQISRDRDPHGLLEVSGGRSRGFTDERFDSIAVNNEFRDIKCRATSIGDGEVVRCRL